MSQSPLDLDSITDSYSQQSTQREDNLRQITNEHADNWDSDDDDDYAKSLLAQVARSNPHALKKMTNFDEADMHGLYAVVESSLQKCSRGKKPKYWGIDALLLLLICFKFAEQWWVFARTWKFGSESAAEKFIRRVIEVVHDPLVQHYVKPMSRAEQIDKGWIKVGTPYTEAIEIIDTKFQMTNRPKGRFAEQKTYYSKKHGAYGIKTEIAHARNGRVMFYSPHVWGSKHDYSLFLERLHIHQNFLAKPRADRILTDNGEMVQQYRLSWALLADKGYVGAETKIRALIPKKDPQEQQEKQRNVRIGKERVLCENYYGRMVMLWGIISKKWRWDHNIYDKVMGICIALTNAHIDIQPLRDGEDKVYKSLLVEYTQLAEEQAAREQEAKRKSRERSKQRLQRLHDT